MTYYVGQPVLSAMSDEDTYTQEVGPNVGEPVVRGIVTQAYEWGLAEVWWEYVEQPVFCLEGDLKVAG
jgi:hypothetical protein